MAKTKPSQILPPSPIFCKLILKLVLGSLFLFFFLSYEPVFAFPPVKKSIVLAQTEQSQHIVAQAIPIVFQLPHPGYLSTSFSSYHPGIDIATGLGMPIKPVAKGVVINHGFNLWGLGLNVEIDHGNNYRSLYAHMGRIYVKNGQPVSENDFLGEVGLTGHTSGPHTHLEIFKDGNRIDPQKLLPEIRLQPQAQDFNPVTQKASPKPQAAANLLNTELAGIIKLKPQNEKSQTDIKQKLTLVNELPL